MTKFLPRIMLLVMLKSMICCEPIFAETENLNYNCLSRNQVERIVNCFDQNAACHTALEDATTPPETPSQWKNFMLIAMAGLVGGVVLSQQLRH